jgi:hypothetical protein
MLATLGVGIGALAMGMGMPPPRFEPLGPGFFPIVIGLLLIAFALYGLLQLLVARRSLGRADVSLILGVGEAEHRKRPGLAVALFASVTAYALAIQFTPLDFTLATAIFVMALSLLLARRRTTKTIVVALVVSITSAAALTLLFGNLLVVALP